MRLPSLEEFFRDLYNGMRRFVDETAELLEHIVKTIKEAFGV